MMTRPALRAVLCAGVLLVGLPGSLPVARASILASASVSVPAGSITSRSTVPVSITSRSVASGSTAPGSTAPGSAAATATPGMGAAETCASVVSYTVDGTHRTTRGLPTPTSRVGGDELAQSGLQVTADATAPPPSPRASAWMVADLDTGRVLAACNAHVPLAPASCLKILTALTLMPRIAADTRYVARDVDAQVDGTRVGLVPGSVYTIDQLWHALLMDSANDAAVALASLGGGVPATTAAMERTARALGADDTVVRNTSGLDLPGQVSSAYDLALFGRAALADRSIAPILTTRAYYFPKAGTGPVGAARGTFQIQSHDRLLFNYPGALGVKDGWTSTTGGSFIGAAERGGRRVIVTVLAADPQTWHMSAALLDWAFGHTSANAAGVGRLADGPEPAGLPVGSGVGSGSGAHGNAASGLSRSGSAGSVRAVGTGSLLTFVLLVALAAAVVTLRRRRAGPR